MSLRQLRLGQVSHAAVAYLWTQCCLFVERTFHEVTVFPWCDLTPAQSQWHNDVFLLQTLTDRFIKKTSCNYPVIEWSGGGAVLKILPFIYKISFTPPAVLLHDWLNGCLHEGAGVGGFNTLCVCIYCIHGVWLIWPSFSSNAARPPGDRTVDVRQVSVIASVVPGADLKQTAQSFIILFFSSSTPSFNK